MRPNETLSNGEDVTALEPPESATHRTPPATTPVASEPVTYTTVPSALAAPVKAAPGPPNASDSARRVFTDERLEKTRPMTRDT